ncbi:restriction endonuclease [Nonomuraea angiospora]|uniref:Adenylate kinase family enzyme n=1 Tax=Nonomuraea angiospora TaxID=46172 RepID=A0ABR9M5J2_9ACTN|nr:restriction endonuclease [Nonomuraea angiospora]MBE1588185.1 adenylate kinase family enzyme [Nonomuraea angiospora]
MDLMDFHKLTDFDFECLCKDLFEAELNVRLEIFTAGGDGGIDLRYMNRYGEKIIIQCKHWMRSGRAKLVQHMLDNELPKVKKIKPTRYIIASTVEMTKDAKDKLYTAFDPFIVSASDVFGINELLALMASHPEVIRKHIRLWLNDVNMLEAAISRNILWRSMHFADDIQQTLRTYVPTTSYRHALKLLDANHVCIITGGPGVGKTTLAQVLSAYYAYTGYELVAISENIEDAYRMWNANAKQVFVYDDFLGQSTLEDKLYKNEDARLIALLRRIGREPNKRLICTTRSYILAQGKNRYERLDRENFDPITCVVDLDSYDRETKARILYNHTFWSTWPAAEKARLAQPDGYRKIIDHPNFNPRIISDVLGTSYDSSWGDITAQLEARLNDPTHVWRHIFENQLTEKERILLATLFSLGGEALLPDIKEALLCHTDWDSSQMRRSLQILDGTFIKVYREQSRQYVEFSNPSVNDFVIRKMNDDNSLLKRVLRTARSFDQVSNIWLYHPDADACDQPEVEIDLHPLSREIEEAALVTLEAAKASTHRLVGYLAIALDMSDKLCLPRLGERVAAHISKQGSIYGGRYEDIAALIRATASSPNPQIRKLHKSVLAEGLTALFNRDRSEKGLFTAATWAHRLAEFVDKAVLRDIDAQAVERADYLMELYEYGSPDDVLDDDELVAAFEFMRIFSDYYVRWPGASEAMEGYGIDNVSDEDSEEDEDIDPEWSDGLIYTIMSFLNQEANP